MVYKWKPISELSEDKKIIRREQARRWNAKWKKKYPEKYRQITKSYANSLTEQEKKKRKIRIAVQDSLRKKILEQRMKCEQCGSKENLDIHHIKYINKPEYVLLVCRICHAEIHRKLREANKNKVSD